METNENYKNITISIANPLEPPLVTIDGMTYPLVSIEYNYLTDTDYRGEHNLIIKYKEYGNVTTTIVGFDKYG